MLAGHVHSADGAFGLASGGLLAASGLEVLLHPLPSAAQGIFLVFVPVYIFTLFINSSVILDYGPTYQPPLRSAVTRFPNKVVF